MTSIDTSEVPDPTTPDSPRTSRGSALVTAYAAVALLFIGFNLRIGVSGVGLLLPEIEQGLGISPAVAGTLTTIPVLAFGVFAFLTPGLIRRLGLTRLLWVTMIVAAIGIAIRAIDSPVALFGGTVLLGAALAVANVCMPAVIKRDFSAREDLMMGLYTVVLSLGAALVAAFMVPLMSAFGGSWRGALAFWALPAIIAFALWAPLALRRSSDESSGRAVDRSEASNGPKMRLLLRDPLAWAVTGFMGLQSLTYYSMITWNATILRDAGTSAADAGFLLAFGIIPALLASLTAAAMYHARPTWLPVAISTAAEVVALIGLFLAPSGVWLWIWMACLGLGQGSAITLALGYIALRSPDTSTSVRLSTMAQGFGYLFAALGPIGVGALYTCTGGWGWPIFAILLLLIAQFLTGAAASRERHVLSTTRV